MRKGIGYPVAGMKNRFTMNQKQGEQDEKESNDGTGSKKFCNDHRRKK